MFDEYIDNLIADILTETNRERMLEGLPILDINDEEILQRLDREFEDESYLGNRPLSLR